MWKTLHWFLRIYCNWDFYYFGAVSSGIVRKTWLFLTQRWLLFLLSWSDKCSDDFDCTVFPLLSGFSLLFLLLFLNLSLCDQLFLLTALWNVPRLHIIYIDLETESSLDQTILDSWPVCSGDVNSTTLVLPQTGYNELKFWSLELPLITGCYPGGFSQQKNNLWTQIYLKSDQNAHRLSASVLFLLVKNGNFFGFLFFKNK